MIKAVIFDFGGVVKKSEQGFYKDISKVYGVSEQEFVGVFKKPLAQLNRADISEQELWDKISQKLNVPTPENVRELFKQAYRTNLYLFPEIIELIKELKEKKIRTAVLSNVIKIHAEVIRENKGYDLFDKVILSCEVGLVKPEKKIYQIALSELGTEPKQAIFIDDREDNLLPAQEMGIRTVLAVNPEQVVKEVKQIIKESSPDKN